MTNNIGKRKIQILKLIVEEYIKTWDLTWSKSLLKKYNLWVSSATIRNDMASLEKMWLIFKPYDFSWRFPTTRWIRVFVDYLMEQMPQIFLEANEELDLKLEKNKTDDILYLLVSKLTKITWEITFACIPEEGTNYYLWLSNFIQKNISIIWNEVYNIIKVLEDKYNFIDLLKNLDISKKITIFIWEENIIPDLESCTMIVKKINIRQKEWYLWILWSIKTDYAFNIAALKNVL